LSQSVDKLLRKAQRYITAGNSAEAEEICRGILSQFPKNKKASKLYQELRTPPQVTVDKLITLFNSNQLEKTDQFGRSLAIRFPNAPILYEILGAANLSLEKTNDAISIYHKLLSLNPKHVDALNNLGIAFYRQGNFSKAAENYQKALEIEPNFADAHYNLGNALTQIGNVRKAVESYKKSHAINPNDAEVLTSYGKALWSYGSFEQAIECYTKLLKTNPDLPHIQAEINKILDEKSQFCRILDYHTKNAGDELSPAEFNFFEGATFLAMLYPEAAIDKFRTAIKNKANYAEAYHSIGKILHDAGKVEEGIENYQKAVEINPKREDTYLSLGTALKQNGKIKEARENYQKAIEVQPDFVEAFNSMGVLELDENNFDVAEKNFNQAIKINPKHADSYNNLGIVQLYKYDVNSALESHRRAIEMDPTNAKYHLNIAIAFRNIGDSTLAMQSYKEALKIDPTFAKAHLNLAIEYLHNEDFKNGWPKYEWRWKSVLAGQELITSKPVWQSFKRDRVLLWQEQGVGDEIMFASIIPDLQLSCSKLIVQVDPRLVSIFRRSFSDNIDFQPKSDPISESKFDSQIPFGTLPQYFRQNLESFQIASRGWLTANNAKTDSLRARLLEDGSEIIIGISWQSTKPRNGAEKKVISLAQIAKKLHGPKIKLVNLQYGDVSKELDNLKKNFNIDVVQVHEIDNKDDLDGLASLIMACDRVVSISNATIHLAGALGKKSDVLLAFSSDWRWGKQSDSSYWYESVRLHRQTKINDWETVLERL
jgi:tetratricopeptide (TPR) repeat protein